MGNESAKFFGLDEAADEMEDSVAGFLRIVSLS